MILKLVSDDDKSPFQAVRRTRSVSHTSDPIWNQRLELDEIGDGEYLKIKCYTEETFGEENIGSARVNLEGLVEGSVRDVWIPLEKVNSGELHLQIEAVMVEDNEGSKVCRAAELKFNLVIFSIVTVII